MKSLAIVIPAFNEEKRLPETLMHIHSFFQAAHSYALKEIIVVDDGSTDATASMAKEWAAKLPIRVIGFPRNRGKGAACRAGMESATAEFVLLYDADGATPIDEVSALMERQAITNASVVIGSRVHGTAEKYVSMQSHRRFVGRTFHLLCAPLLPSIDDASCGCKLFTSTLAKKIARYQRIDRFAFDIEILMLARVFGERIEEVPVAWRAVHESKVRLLRDGMEMFVTVLSLYIRKMTGTLTRGNHP
jgi:glycosyltransferase involved in cell wall biosynthesis